MTAGAPLNGRAALAGTERASPGDCGYYRRVRPGARPLTICAFFAGLLASFGGCLENDPNHCFHKQGNASCTDDAFPYCSKCVKSSEHGGCVAEPPDASCRVEGDDIAGTTAPTSTGSGDGVGDDDDGSGTATATGMTTGPVDCSAEGGVDEMCPAESPYCIGGTCASCDAGDEGFCAGVDEGHPVCAASGLCVQCSSDAFEACAGGEFCSPAGVCGGCTSHEQCAPAGCEGLECQACDFFSGECFDGTAYWVDSEACTAPGFGSQENPYCDIATAMSNLGNGFDVFTVWVRGTTAAYDGPVALSATGNQHKIAVIGEGSRPRFTGSTVAASVSAANNRLILSGIDFEDGSQAVVRCSNKGRLWLDDVVVRDGNIGVDASDCTVLQIHDSIITSAATIGLDVAETQLTMFNTAVGNNGDGSDATFGGISLSASPDWVISYSTIAANLRDSGTSGGGLSCANGSPGTARNSIFLSPNGGEAVDCGTGEFTNTVSDSRTLPGEGNVMTLYMPSLFTNPDAADFHVRLIAGESPFQDVARWGEGDPPTDVDGDLRPLVPGAADWVGFDRLP